SEVRHTDPNQAERPPSPGIRRSPRPVRRPSADPVLAQPMSFTSSDVAVFLSACRDEASANDTPGSQIAQLATEGLMIKAVYLTLGVDLRPIEARASHTEFVAIKGGHCPRAAALQVLVEGRGRSVASFNLKQLRQLPAIGNRSMCALALLGSELSLLQGLLTNYLDNAACQVDRANGLSTWNLHDSTPTKDPNVTSAPTDRIRGLGPYRLLSLATILAVKRTFPKQVKPAASIKQGTFLLQL
ncbi:hypothetical protein THAOC_02786, partial [Thalassiosira oceanica]